MRTGRFPRITKHRPTLLFYLAAALAIFTCIGTLTCTGNAALDKDLIEAAKSGDLTAVKKLLARGADVNARDSRGWTALLWALWQGKEENGPYHPLASFETWAAANAVKLDHPHPDELNRPTSVSSGQHGEVVKLLLDDGADVNERHDISAVASGSDFRRGAAFIKDSTALTEGSTDLIWPVVLGHADLVKLLLDKGADVNAKLRDGSTALMWAAMLGHMDVVKALKAHGADEPLNIAAMLGDKRRVQQLLQAGADPNARDGNGRTALMEAAWRGDPEIARALLDKGADPNAKDGNGRTVLMEAAWRGDPDTTRVLMSHGAEPNVVPCGTRSLPPLMEAIHRDNLGTLKVLLDCGAAPYRGSRPAWTALMEASSRGNLAAAQLLLEKGAQVNGRDFYGDTALKLAVDCGATEVVKLLMDKGADINAKTSDGSTVLMWAVLAGEVEIVKLLLDQGVDVNAGIKEGSSALLWAAVTDRREIVELLRSHGAKVSLSVVVLLDDEKEVRRLLESGVDPNSAEANGWTPLMNAAWKGNVTMVELLRAHGAKEQIASQDE